jgi:hypothetical protein
MKHKAPFPKSKHEAINTTAAEHVERPQRLILNLTVDEFDDINKAGILSDMTLSEYARDRLLAAAAQENNAGAIERKKEVAV